MPVVHHNPVLFDYAQASGLTLDPELRDALNQLMADDPREVIYQLDRDATQEASGQFDQLRDQLLAQEQERIQLWGKKYPPVPGLKPGEVDKRKGVRLHPIPFSRKTGA